jgi:hypothetical protein
VNIIRSRLKHHVRGLRLDRPLLRVGGELFTEEYDAAVLAFKAGAEVGKLARRLKVDVERAHAWGLVAIAARV